MSLDANKLPSLRERLGAAAAEGLEPNASRLVEFLGPGALELQILGAPDRFAPNRFAHPRSTTEALHLIHEAERLRATGVYAMINAPDEAVTTRMPAGRWHPTPKGTATTDGDIRFRRALFVDVDATRVRGTSATEEELAFALATTEKVFVVLETIVGSRPLAVGHSGNGGAVFLALDALPETPTVAAVCRGIVVALAHRFANESGSHIDVTVCDAKRLCPAFGTTKRKGATGVERRPHRRTAIITPPAASVERLSFARLSDVLDVLHEELPEAGRDAVDKATGRKPAPSTATRPLSPSTTSSEVGVDPFALAKRVLVRDVLAWLNLVDHETGRPKCPGCGLFDPGVAIVKNGLKCSHNRCAAKGRPGGFRTTVDIVSEARDVRPIEAVRLLAQRFGFEVPERPRLAKPASMTAAPGWFGELTTIGRGELAKTAANAITILSRDDAWQGVIVFDEFGQAIRTTRPAPWDEVDRPSGHVAGDWSDTDDTRLCSWLSRRYQLHVGVETAHQAVEVVARRHIINPPLDYLNSLRWDATRRVDRWLRVYLGVPHTPYSSRVGRFFLISAVARLRQPGCKVDTMPILEGPQGARKSTAIATLFGRAWTSDTPPELTSKDRFLCLRDRWCIEWSELDGMARADTDRLKGFLSSPVDDYRAAYARAQVRVPRRAVFFGTVNRADYLRDETGNRRFWPVQVGIIDVDALARDRDQLWGEAVELYDAGERWWPHGGEEIALFNDEQSARVVEDPWLDKIREHIETRDRVTVPDILGTVLNIEPGRWSQADQTRVARCLILLGRRRMRGLVGAGRERQWCYERQKGAHVLQGPSSPSSIEETGTQIPE